ncbi:MAG: nucleotidyltransferase family protein [Candidatus Eremiobacteraeota bacterium]|nr:nucleotidyltransferase family protein [Candidatus Eremiobacteraeota bacterium]
MTDAAPSTLFDHDDERRARERPPRRADLASPAAQGVYRRVIATLQDGAVPFLVGGAYAFTPVTGIPRSTKDFDLFIARDHIARAFDVLGAAGFRTDLTFPHWLGKAFWGKEFVDLIFGSGNGVAPVDAGWFAHAPTCRVLGIDVLVAPAEEMLWSKSFVMERERYDGGDVIHLLRSRAEQLDWTRVLDRFGEHWRVLLANLLLFGFVYPGERTRIPRWVMDELLARTAAELGTNADVGRLCRGTMLSRQQYLPDVTEWGYADGRLAPHGSMSPAEIADWTAAIGTKA